MHKQYNSKENRSKTFFEKITFSGGGGGFYLNSKGSFICTIPQTGSHIPWPLLTRHGALAGMRNRSMGPPRGIKDPSHHELLHYHGDYITVKFILYESRLKFNFKETM